MNLSGIYPPISTPFKNEEVDYASLTHNVRRWMTTGLRGLLALGSNGEAAYVDEDEAERIVATVRDDVPRDRVLLVGTGRQSTRATIAATMRAAKAGADAVLVLTPYFLKNQMTPDVLVGHFRAVADASPVPVLLYNNTSITSVNLPSDSVAALSAHPNIVGMKDSNGDVGQVAATLARVSPAFTLLVGSAATLFPSLMVGAAGGIIAVANVVPDVCVKLDDLVRAGKYDDARLLQRRLTPLAQAVTGGYSIPGLKMAMEMAGYVGGDVRRPLRSATPGARDAIRRLYDELMDSLG